MTEPAELARSPQVLVIDLAPDGPVWKAASTQVTGFTAWGCDRADAEAEARAQLEPWIGPHVTLEFREPEGR